MAAFTSSSDPPGAPSKPAGVTGRLSTWVYSLQYSDIPGEVIERAKYLVLDSLACAFVGARLPWTERAVSALRSLEPAGSCSLIGWGPHVRVSPTTACLLNSTSVQAFELDDFHSRGPMHSNAVLVPALFAAVESAAHQTSSSSTSSAYPGRIFTGAELLRAFVIGHEIGPRIGMAMHGSDVMARGWHPGSVQGPPAAAAAVSALLGLNPRQIEWAIGTGGTQSGGLTSARFGSDTKRMQHGFAARNGLTAAILSREGFVGIEDVFEIPNGGFLPVFGQGSVRDPMPERVVDGLGERWEIEAAVIKLHAAMGGLLGPIDVVKGLQSKYKERFEIEHIQENLEHVTVELSKSIFNLGGWIAPRDKPMNAMSAQMSAQYSIAAQLIDRQVLMKQYDKDNLNRPLLRMLMDKIEPVLSSTFDQSPATTFATRVQFQYKDGFIIEDELKQPISFSASKEDVLRKWRSLATDVLSDEQRDKIERTVLELDKLEDVTQLISILVNEVPCAIKL